MAPWHIGTRRAGLSVPGGGIGFVHQGVSRQKRAASRLGAGSARDVGRTWGWKGSRFVKHFDRGKPNRTFRSLGTICEFPLPICAPWSDRPGRTWRRVRWRRAAGSATMPVPTAWLTSERTRGRESTTHWSRLRSSSWGAMLLVVRIDSAYECEASAWPQIATVRDPPSTNVEDEVCEPPG